ncbi:MAG: 16S rRNA (cytosine(1402)-N(4))-methyltransferase RsmH [Gammaproteobacteria bacterium]|nr:16S rRNA (cytosine(1402)-N(4))-methyltransferase RsmH [Gammaproteobacteria bacterium]MCY4228217.1 16S rRNA (cytosine(1402)-N(4))-methyltransferase RsmH [Gammaproteobacteria bacterium]MCY4313395.1 16S rRNA (cytosine(1402)-N(4))-methyltransferase RsmH [Gammaproteobacteria bacterium]
MTHSQHIPVMIEELLSIVKPEQCQAVVDATYGRGGHATAIHGRLPSDARMVLIDRDPEAISHARSVWQAMQKVDIVHAAFSRLGEELQALGLFGKIDAIIFDFGVSSPQLDNHDRGFSFSHDGPLDMRMDNSSGPTALEWMTDVSEKKLAQVLWEYGEERFSRAIAASIKQAASNGSVQTTRDLEQLVIAAQPFRDKHKHPATRTFQAIRIAVNNEVSEIEQGLEQALESLAPEGRLVAISFHSIEDRIVKRFIRNQSRGDYYPPEVPVSSEMIHPRLRQIGKPLKPGAKEVHRNPRSRSAVFRAAQKIA